MILFNDMASSIYQINKGINQPIEFKGLKAQFIGYFGIGLVVFLIGFAVMYLIGIPSLLGIGIVLISGTLFTGRIYSLSNKYGTHGLMKVVAAKQVPRFIRSNSRQVFFSYKKNWKETKR